MDLFVFLSSFEAFYVISVPAETGASPGKLARAYSDSQIPDGARLRTPPGPEGSNGIRIWQVFGASGYHSGLLAF
jgi:hypothetical protein